MAVIEKKLHDFDDVKTSWAFETLSKLYGEDLATAQLGLEHESHMMGEAKFHKALERQIERAEFAETSVAKPLVAMLVPRFTAELEEWKHHQMTKVRRKSVALKFLNMIKGERVAALTIKLVITELARQRDSLASVTTRIGRVIEEEARFGRIRDEEAKHFQKHIKDALNKRNGHTYKKAFMEAVETKMLEAGELNGAWADWQNEDSDIMHHIGARCLEILIKSTGLVELHRVNPGSKTDDLQTVKITAPWLEQLSQRAFSLAGINTINQPMVVPPRPWTRPVGGGYWGKGRRPTRFIRTHTKAALERYRDVNMSEVYKAVNLAQNTAWAINKPVLEVAKALLAWPNVPVKKWPSSAVAELPVKPSDIDENPDSLKAWKKEAAAVYRGEAARVSRRLSLELNVETASKFADYEAIYFPHNLDWRGRVYSLTSFSPQGNDVTKGLLQASKGEPIGEDGIQWLMIHGANTAGVDKVPFDERKQWVRDNEECILGCARDPLQNTEWMSMDSPFCFLAFCFEWAGVKRDGANHVSALPIAFDGSCSGIQHFSAMLRDEVGGRAVNLLPSPTVQDIYRLVSDGVNSILRDDVDNGTDDSSETVVDKKSGEIRERRVIGTRTLAAMWLAYGVDRSVTKRSVMTLAYGSKEFGFCDQVRDDIVQPAIDAGKTMFTDAQQASRYMAHLIWVSVGKTVVAAVEAMGWLQASAKLLSSEVKDKKTKEILKPAMPVYWVTPDGFPVWQEYKVADKVRIDLIFLGDVRLQTSVMQGDKPTNKIDARKQESGISPNFVHSLDGSHLRMTVVKAHEAYDVSFFALIHDSFGTIPAHAGKLFKAVRETMVDTYENHDVLADFRDQFIDQLHETQMEKMPSLPTKGALQIREILKSEFAFA
ncbi:RNA polymerase [Pseudomonas phage vB_PpuP-AnF1]|uniref:DNA-directed RNA polymerase n=1 Tax=Pseudomonas phage Pf-10 TaxID=1562076 RepID=A0A0A0YSI2_9CAUD|nr:RNA polymerase [Pseudomonas phage Pf-10]AIX12970.1 DNA-directed RNA polymerase [Pseudomonas phage Pf-10]QIN95125.1 RNA polymerase [Pseudomonas phage BIM BV-46]